MQSSVKTSTITTLPRRSFAVALSANQSRAPMTGASVGAEPARNGGALAKATARKMAPMSANVERCMMPFERSEDSERMTPLRVVCGVDPAIAFEHPRRTLRAFDPAAAMAALAEAESALSDGAWIAGYLSYELGAQLCGASARMHVANREHAHPLLVLGCFDEPRAIELPPTHDGVTSPLLGAIDHERFS